ncbi:MAG: transglycosylase SLT domain-containing protein [Rhodocyclaceae bacterium]|nr:transglycosylase SLT domain-containing protein [Rhodocyclaceae bacterium]
MRATARRLLGLCLGMTLLAAGPAAAHERNLDTGRSSRLDLARALEHGEGIERDPSRARELYCSEARSGNVEAMHALGWMYANGRGGPRDDGIAGTLFAMAAFRGHVQAGNMLRLLGGHRGEVPECLLPPPGERKRQFADRDEWRVDDYVARLHAMQRPHARLVARLADEYGIAPRLALAIARAESDFDPAAVSDRNAVGLMQLMADTAERFGVADIHDPEQNVRGGLAYLRWLLAYYRGRVALAVAAYNAGEGAVDRYRGVPPYPETRRYVDKVGARYPFAHHPFDEAGSLGRSPVSVVEPALAAAGDPR